MNKYKLDVSYGEAGPRLNVFDLDDPEPGPIDSCVVGQEVADRPALRDAWGRYHDSDECGSSRFELVMAMDTAAGTVKLLLFDDDDLPGPIDECEVGERLDYDLLSEAFHKYHEEREQSFLNK